MKNINIFNLIFKQIKSRKLNNPIKSYISSLFLKGDDEILKKIGEECMELIISAKNVHINNKKKKLLIYECTDLLFHIIIMLYKFNINIKNIEHEFIKRYNISGIIEKKNRKQF